MANHKIVIETANESNGKLGLDPEDTVYVDSWDKVTWSITADNVVSFYIEHKRDTDDIFFFLDKPPSKHTKEGSGRVKLFPRAGAEYEYAIHWKDRNNMSHTFDPKIAVDPIQNNSKLILGVVIGLLGLLSLGLVSRIRSKR